MKIPKEELVAILSQFNPWWRGEKIPDLPVWRREAFQELMQWIQDPPAQRAVMILGPRQVGKTTLIQQAIQQLLDSGVPPANILYTTFDHPICKLGGLHAVLEAWRELEPKANGPEYLFLDEAQFIKDIGTWIKHQVDFTKFRKIVFTGSATPLIHQSLESGVGRWHTLNISTLSFYEYLQLKNIQLPSISIPQSLYASLDFSFAELHRMTEDTASLIGHFHEYLIRGGFPQTALIESITQSQRLLREDIIDKVLKRDMTALFGVRRVIELEQLFIFLCMHDGGIQDVKTISRELGISTRTVQNFIDLFESTHLIYKLFPFGYGKEVLRGKHKLYLRDPAIAPAVLMKGKSILQDPQALGRCVETAVTGHLCTGSSASQERFSYWQNKKQQEIDLITETETAIIPFEVKYRSQVVQISDIPGLCDFAHQRKEVIEGFVITKLSQDVGPLTDRASGKRFMKIPASLFCYWVGALKFAQKDLYSR